MNNFSKKSIWFPRNEDAQDPKVKVADLIKLIDSNNIGIDLLRLMKVNTFEDEYINIPNAGSLVAIQKAINKKYHKEDLTSSSNDISLFTPDGKFTINFNNLNENEYFQSLGLTSISTIPIHSAQANFFSELYQMDRYAAKLLNNGHQSIVEINWELLQQVTSFTKNFRILHDLQDNKFYVRAITSTSRYYNYDNNIAIVIALLILHNEMKAGQVKFRLASCEYNESYIRMSFESSEKTPLEGVGYVKNYIEVSNDEIRREAVRFSGACSIAFSDGQNAEEELFIDSKEVKSKILSIRHNVRPNTATKELASIANSKDIHAELFKDITTIKNIKKPEQIKLLLLQKIEKAKREDVGNLKGEIQKILQQSTSNILQLLSIFSKIEVFAREDVAVAEYLRIAIYEVLIKRK